MRRIVVPCLCVLLASMASPASAQPPKGHLLIIGGNGTTDDIVSRAVQTAGGTRGVVVIFPQASELPETGDAAVEMWTKAGIGRAVKADPKNPAAALKAVSEATFVWFPGGDQTRLMKALENTGIPEAIRTRYADGALVGGTSAGAAVMSRLMITGDAYDLQAITAGKTDIKAGLGLWPDVMFDQHFLKRQRNNRLLSAVLDHPEAVGVGIDETTAVFVTGGLAAGRGLKLSVLKAGMVYDLDEE